MIDKISNTSTGNSLKMAKNEQISAENAVNGLVIPLILLATERRECKQLRFVQPCQLKANALRALNHTELFYAKVVVENNLHSVKLDRRLKDWNFEEIIYDYDNELHTFRKDDVTEMDEEEQEEVAGLVDQALKEKSNSIDDKSEKSNSDKSVLGYASPKERFSVSPLAFARMIHASFEKRERVAIEKQQDEQAKAAKDAQKRKTKDLDKRWELRQKYYAIKEETRQLILKAAVLFWILRP